MEQRNGFESQASQSSQMRYLEVKSYLAIWNVYVRQEVRETVTCTMRTEATFDKGEYK